MLVLIIVNTLALGYCIFYVKTKQVELRFLLDNNGLLYLPKLCLDGHHCGENISDTDFDNFRQKSLNYKGYSLEKSSRINCYAVWLVLRPLKEESISGVTLTKNTANKSLLNDVHVKNFRSNKTSNNLKRLVIYKDSLTKQDFSCLARIINNL